MTDVRFTAFLLLSTVFCAAGPADACVSPEPPFLPASREDMLAYADLIREDFETYIVDVQQYFRCLDKERARTFSEAGKVSEDYRRFLAAIR